MGWDGRGGKSVFSRQVVNRDFYRVEIRERSMDFIFLI